MGVIANQAAALKTAIESVTDVGVVYDYQPFPKNDWAQFVTTLTVVIGGNDKYERGLSSTKAKSAGIRQLASAQ